MTRVSLWHFEDKHLREENSILRQSYKMGTRIWNGYKAMEWVQGFGMGTRLWNGYKAMEWVLGYGMGTRLST